MPRHPAFAALPLCCFAAFLTACSTPTSTTTVTVRQPATAAAPQPPQLFQGLGSHTRSVSTKNPEAQTYFNQALTWTFSFNHDEAIRDYQHAADLDPNLAIAYWGIALCNGPHINNPVMDEPRARAAWDALQRARTLAPNASPSEQALITALAGWWHRCHPSRAIEVCFETSMLRRRIRCRIEVAEPECHSD